MEKKYVLGSILGLAVLGGGWYACGVISGIKDENTSLKEKLGLGQKQYEQLKQHEQLEKERSKIGTNLLLIIKKSKEIETLYEKDQIKIAELEDRVKELLVNIEELKKPDTKGLDNPKSINPNPESNKISVTNLKYSIFDKKIESLSMTFNNLSGEDVSKLEAVLDSKLKALNKMKNTNDNYVSFAYNSLVIDPDVLEGGSWAKASVNKDGTTYKVQFKSSLKNNRDLRLLAHIGNSICLGSDYHSVITEIHKYLK